MRLKSIIFTIFLCLILCLSSWGYQYYTVTNLSLTTATAVGPYRFQPSQARNVGITDYTSLLTDFTFYVSSGRLVVTGPYTISGTEPILYHPHQGIVQGQDLGTVAWYNAPLAVAYGGTAANTATDARTNLGISAGSLLPTSIQGDMIYASAVDTWIILSKSTSATRYLSNTGANNNPAWAQVALGTGVSGVLPIANGGTGASAKATAFDNLSPTSTLGDLIYYSTTNTHFIKSKYCHICGDLVKAEGWGFDKSRCYGC
jgi:hypothetical protein